LSISTSTSSICAGTALNIDYNAQGIYDPGNSFMIELSDENGTFATPIVIGGFANVGIGNLDCVLPQGLTQGNGYRVRLVATLPSGMSTSSSSFTVQALPIAAVSMNVVPGNIVCSGDNVIFQASPTNGGTSPIYNWKWNGIHVGNNTFQYSNAMLQDGDIVWVEMTSNAPCASSSPIVSPIGAMRITTVAVPFIQAIDNLLATSTDIGVQWYLNGQPISGATGQFYTASQSGFYQVKVTMDGCTVASALFSYTSITSDSDPKPADFQSVTVFPNPTCGGFTVKIGSKPLDGARVKVYNSLQVLIYDDPVVNNVAEIDLGNQPNGSYFVRIESRKGQFSKVVVKQ
jgi:hypothetical protein